jgi:hypothetical protein
MRPEQSVNRVWTTRTSERRDRIVDDAGKVVLLDDLETLLGIVRPSASPLKR